MALTLLTWPSLTSLTRCPTESTRRRTCSSPQGRSQGNSIFDQPNRRKAGRANFSCWKGPHQAKPTVKENRCGTTCPASAVLPSQGRAFLLNIELGERPAPGSCFCTCAKTHSSLLSQGEKRTILRPAIVPFKDEHLRTGTGCLDDMTQNFLNLPVINSPW